MSSFSRRQLLVAASALGLPLLTSVPVGAEPLRRQPNPLPNIDPASVDLLPDRLAVADAMVADAVANQGVPGAVLLVGRRGGVVLHKAYGNAVLRPGAVPMTADTVFDLASLTKPVATATSVAQLIEQNRISLEATVAEYLPAFARADGDRARITVRHLLTHCAGFPAGGAYAGKTRTLPQIIDEIVASRQMSAPGTQFLYSDFSFITLGAVVEAVSGEPLHRYAERNVFAPLGMASSGYRPEPRSTERIAATTSGDASPENLGRVHDPTAQALGGVAGHAGLFSTAGDLARFCQMLLNGGELDGARILKPETVAQLTAKQSPFIGEARALGWDLDSAYSVRGALPPGSFGHTGFTGTSLWIDPLTETFVILLTNAVHAEPSRSSVVIPLRRQIATVVASAIADLPPGPGRIPVKMPASLDDQVVVQTGLDVLQAEKFARLRGRKVGVVCNHTAVDRQGRHLADLITENRDINLVAFFGPEHGIRGEVDASVGDSVDAKTGRKVYSLYNLKLPKEQRYRPTAEQFSGIDTLVFDIQDIGARYYTYIATLGYCMERAAKMGIRVIVLDRPNPLGGLLMEGPILDPKLSGQFTAYHTIPITHGMTVGELARMYNAERKIGANLEVVKMPNWNRRLLWDQTGLPWINPSPNIRNVREAALYPGIGFLEGLPLSVGRGTDMPFEILGAPWIDGAVLADRLNQRRLPGVSFVPARFTPTSSKHKGKLCGGVQVNLWDRRICRPSELGIYVIDALARLYPEKLPAPTLSEMRDMIGNDTIPAAIARGDAPEAIIASWSADIATWRKRREGFLLY
jgi:uncharacterized protein YbbC (DUF1343 family)/CubicO group peptidase (beta-lactamase class C family)